MTTRTAVACVKVMWTSDFDHHRLVWFGFAGQPFLFGALT